MKSIFLGFCFAFTVLCSATEQSERGAAAKLVDELLEAIEFANVSEVQSLIDRGVQLNYEYMGKDEKPLQFPLHHAIGGYMLDTNWTNFNEEIFKLLIKKGENLEVLDIYESTPLMKATDHDNVKAVKILLENGANPNAYNKRFKKSALQGTLNTKGHHGDEIAILLIEHGANVNEADAYGETLLHKAISRGYKNTIEMLIEKGANVNAAEEVWHNTPLHFVAMVDSHSPYHDLKNWTEDDSLKFAELLINHGADANAKAHYLGDDNSTPLHRAKSAKLKEYLRSKMT